MMLPETTNEDIFSLMNTPRAINRFSGKKPVIYTHDAEAVVDLCTLIRARGLIDGVFSLETTSEFEDMISILSEAYLVLYKAYRDIRYAPAETAP